MKRSIVKIDENRCTGCGACVEGCHGGALQIIDSKARIINETYCDGLGACIGTCPAGAITIEERETKPAPKQAITETKCCPSLQELLFGEPTKKPQSFNFPIQLLLINPNADVLKDTDLVLAADCTAFIFRNFYYEYAQNNSLAIACPKLDNAKDIYVEKLTEMIDNASINSLTVVIMEVPCCKGLLQIAQQARAQAKRKIPIQQVTIPIKR